MTNNITSQKNPSSIYLFTVKFLETFSSVTKWLKDFFKDVAVLNAINIIFGLFRKDYLLLNDIIILFVSK